MNRLFLTIFLLLCSGTGYTRDYYVSNGGSDKYFGTETLPWATLEKAEKTAGSGDRIYLHRGSMWKAQFQFRSSNMQIDAYGSGPPPIIDGSSLYFSIAVSGKSNIVIRNLQLINAANDCIRVEQNGVTSHHIAIEGNIITGCKTNGINVSPSDIEISANKLPYDIQISRNHISRTGNAAIEIRAQADIGINKITYNVIDSAGMTYATNAISLNDVHNIVVEHNTITNTRSTDIDGSGITADYLNKNMTGSGSIIRYNDITCPTPAAHEEQAGIAIWFQPDVKIYNNTIRNCNEGIRVSGESSGGYEIHHNDIISARKRGASFTSAASYGRLEYNNFTGIKENDIGIAVNLGSKAPVEKYNNINNFHLDIADMNNTKATLHNTDTNHQPR